MTGERDFLRCSCGCRERKNKEQKSKKNCCFAGKNVAAAGTGKDKKKNIVYITEERECFAFKAAADTGGFETLKPSTLNHKPYLKP